MVQFDAKTLAMVKRLQSARLSLLKKHPFYALLLMYMKFSIDRTCETAYTDGNRIAFNPEFMQDLSDSELEFVLMHEVLHTALGHPFRHQQDYDQLAFDIACDIVVNSNILYSCGMDKNAITLKKYDEAMHLAPDGKEGFLYTVEQVYDMICKIRKKPDFQSGQLGGNGDGDDTHTDYNCDNDDAEAGADDNEDDGNCSNNDKNSDDCDDCAYDDADTSRKSDSGDGKGGNGKGKDPQGNGSEGSKEKGKHQKTGEGNTGDNGIGKGDGKGSGKENRQEKGQGKGKGKGQGKGEGKGQGSGTGEEHGNLKGRGVSPGKCGSANPDDPSEEEMQSLIASLLQKNTGTNGKKQNGKNAKERSAGKPGTMEACQNKTLDDHSFWEGDDEIAGQQDVWLQRMVNATDIISSMGGKGCGTMPLAAERIVESLKNPILDWRTILNDFVQEEICDYSFAPPDRRMEDSPFFLPDFNEKDERAKDVLFMIDTSGSMSDKEVTQCYSEIYGAIGQFNGKLEGKLGFFDACIVEPIPFMDESEFRVIRPKGGGGTNFHIIFDYVREYMKDNLPASIVIMTDGYADFPNEVAALGIPVLWIINNDEVDPPWGKVARLLDK